MVSVAAWLLVARRSWKIKVYFEIGALLSLGCGTLTGLLAIKQVLYLGEPPENIPNQHYFGLSRSGLVFRLSK